MKIGSVKFFKVVIIGTTLSLIIIPIIISIALGVYSYSQGHKLSAVDAELTLVKQQLDSALRNNDILAAPSAKVDTPYSDSETQSFEYQGLYPTLYGNIQSEKKSDEHVAYLTFDDGPSSNTMRVLDILSEYDVKATFFVTGPSSTAHPEYLKAAADAGHSIGVHSFSHKYAEIYSSVEAYLADYVKMHSLITDITGTQPSIFRFPGGSINAYNSVNYMSIIAEMTRRGYPYYDWNVSSGDVAMHATQAEIVKNVLDGAKNKQRCIVLMHDRLDTDNTVGALPAIIEGLRSQGYTFAPLTSDVNPITFSYRN